MMPIAHLTRYVGWLIGVEDEWLPRDFRDGIRVLYHTLTALSAPDESTKQLAAPMADDPLAWHYRDAAGRATSAGPGAASVGDQRLPGAAGDADAGTARLRAAVVSAAANCRSTWRAASRAGAAWRDEPRGARGEREQKALAAHHDR